MTLTSFHRQHMQTGFIALSAVLMLSAIFLILVVGSVTRSIGVSKLVTAAGTGAESEAVAHACAEYALAQIVQTLEYAGDEELTLEAGSCEILPISDAVPNERTVRIEAVADGHVHRLVIDLSAIGPDVVLDAYQSVTTF